MKSTPELLQKALRNLEIGLSPEISAKILATVRLLDEKGAEANLIDFALIEACYSEKPQSEPLPSDKLNLYHVRPNDVFKFRNGDTHIIESIIGTTDTTKEQLRLYKITFQGVREGLFYEDGTCYDQSKFSNNNDFSPTAFMYDIVKIIKPN